MRIGKINKPSFVVGTYAPDDKNHFLSTATLNSGVPVAGLDLGAFTFSSGLTVSLYSIGSAEDLACHAELKELMERKFRVIVEIES